MIRHFTLAAAVALCGLVSQGQEILYLVKGNSVVAKYRVSDVDYATFRLPDGVSDDTPSLPSVTKMDFVGAAGTYYGSESSVGEFQVQLSTRPIIDESLPVDFLYLQFTTPPADYKNLTLAEGTYTVKSDADVIEPFRFYAGVRSVSPDGESVGGTMLLSRPDTETNVATLVTDGNFKITRKDSGYSIEGMLLMEDGNVLQFGYEGEIYIDNRSSEKDPAEYLPVPESALTEDVDIASDKVAEAYYTIYNNLFADMPQYRYVYMMIYTDNTYGNCLDLGLLVDTTADVSDGILLPKGKYPVIAPNDPSLTDNALAALPYFMVMGDGAVGKYGCIYTKDYADECPVVAGEVEVLEDAVSLTNVNIRFTLYDNAVKPNKISGSYNGPVVKL